MKLPARPAGSGVEERALAEAQLGQEDLIARWHELRGLLETAIEGESWDQVLTAARHYLLEQLPAVLSGAEMPRWARAAYEEVRDTLAGLPAAAGARELALAWHLLAEYPVGRNRPILQQVVLHLQERTAPDLRALFAEVHFVQRDFARYMDEAARALAEEATPLTLYVFGRSRGLTHPEEGLGWLESSLRAAEKQGITRFAIQIANSLAARYTGLGKPREAREWAAWALKLYERHDVRQLDLHLLITNELHYADLLARSGPAVEGSQPDFPDGWKLSPGLAWVALTTKADYRLAAGSTQDALEIYRQLWEGCDDRHHLGAFANLYVRALLEVGSVETAVEVARRAVTLSQDLDAISRRRATLALGMALSATDPEAAVPVLREAIEQLSSPRHGPRLLQAELYLIKALLAIDRPAEAREVAAAARGLATEFGEVGHRYLAGPAEGCARAHPMLGDRLQRLELRFLGKAEASLGEDRLELRNRFLDLLAVLAMNPGGLTSEELALLVYGEQQDPNLCRVEVGRLRKLVPIASRPYRIAAPVFADFLEVEGLLARGAIAEAVALYEGPLLPRSTAPEIVKTRTVLANALHDAVVASGDPELVWVLAQRPAHQDDRELWEALRDLLPAGDARRVLVEARLEQLLEEW